MTSKFKSNWCIRWYDVQGALIEAMCVSLQYSRDEVETIAYNRTARVDSVYKTYNITTV